MEANIAALLREDARTVKVSYDVEEEDAANGSAPYRKPDTKAYTYVTNLPLAVGDVVAVFARGAMKLASVREVDDEVKIEPNSTTTYQWVVAKIDLEGFRANCERNKAIEQTVHEAYRQNLRRSFAQQILAGVDEARKGELQKLLGSAS